MPFLAVIMTMNLQSSRAF